MVGLFRHCVVWLLFVSPLTFAAGQRTVVVQPGELQPFYSPGQGEHAYYDSRNWDEPVSHQGGKSNVPVTTKKGYKPSTVKNALKNLLKVNPLQVATTVAVASGLAAVDWLFDPENNSIQKSSCSLYGTPYSSCEEAQINFSHCQLPASQTKGHVLIQNTPQASYAYQVVPFASIPSGWEVNSYCTSTSLGYTKVSGYWDTSIRKLISLNDITTSYTPVTDADLDTFLQNVPASYDDYIELDPHLDMPPDSLEFYGPDTFDLPSTQTTTTDSIGNTTTVETLPSLNLEYSSNPLSIVSNYTTTVNTYQNGVQTSTSTTVQTGPETSAPDSEFELPTDCEFMPTLCDWLNWTKEPLDGPEPDLGSLLVDEDYSRSYSFSLGSSCPPPTSITTQLFGTVYFQWQPLCDLAAYIRYLVISGSLLFALYTTLGIHRKGS